MKKWLMLVVLALGTALPAVALASPDGAEGGGFCGPCCCD
jgi:hypothetical protein